jgi:hypothetical protein
VSWDTVGCPQDTAPCPGDIPVSSGCPPCPTTPTCVFRRQVPRKLDLRRHQGQPQSTCVLSFRCQLKQFPAGLRLPIGCTTIQPVPKNGSCFLRAVAQSGVIPSPASPPYHRRSRAVGVARVHRRIQKLSLPIQKLTTLATRGAALYIGGRRSVY